jgi:hypothetical protein
LAGNRPESLREEPPASQPLGNSFAIARLDIPLARVKVLVGSGTASGSVVDDLARIAKISARCEKFAHAYGITCRLDQDASLAFLRSHTEMNGLQLAKANLVLWY